MFSTILLSVTSRLSRSRQSTYLTFLISLFSLLSSPAASNLKEHCRTSSVACCALQRKHLEEEQSALSYLVLFDQSCLLLMWTPRYLYDSSLPLPGWWVGVGSSRLSTTSTASSRCAGPITCNWLTDFLWPVIVCIILIDYPVCVCVYFLMLHSPQYGRDIVKIPISYSKCTGCHMHSALELMEEY